MELASVCPLRVAALRWQPREGTHVLTLVVKATFDLVPGRARLAQVQDFPNDEDNHWNDDPQHSLYSASDMAPFKLRADVTLVGEAFAPTGEPVRALVTRLCVGSIDKAIEVHCDRYFGVSDELVEGKRFTRMALRYERAGGGVHTSNPVGIDPDGDRDPYGRMPL